MADEKKPDTKPDTKPDLTVDQAPPIADQAPPERPAGASASSPVAGDGYGDQVDELLAARNDDPSAREVAVAAAKQAEKDAAAAVPGQAEPDTNEHGQVKQEGAHVETPPQPATPPFTDGEIRHMDKSPAGLREPSVAAGSDDTDQTRHPQSRVDDPSKPL